MRKTISVLITAVVALGLGGCGGDDDDGGEASAEDSTETTSAASDDTGTEDTGGDEGEGEAAATPTGGDLDKYCELSASLDESFPEDADADTEEELAEILKQHFDEHEGEYDEIVKAAPDDIEEEAAKAVDILRRVADGDLTALQDPAFDQVASTLDEFDTAHCGD
jgi:hypothetical protein